MKKRGGESVGDEEVKDEREREREREREKMRVG